MRDTYILAANLATFLSDFACARNFKSGVPQIAHSRPTFSQGSEAIAELIVALAVSVQEIWRIENIPVFAKNGCIFRSAITLELNGDSLY